MARQRGRESLLREKRIGIRKQICRFLDAAQLHTHVNLFADLFLNSVLTLRRTSYTISGKADSLELGERLLFLSGLTSVRRRRKNLRA